MSHEMNDAELEAMIAELASTEEERAALLEEHRQLEKDLLRLADPLPPPDFVSGVMRRVAEAPRRVSRVEFTSAIAIVATTVGLAAIAFLSSGGGAGSVGLALARWAVEVREALVAMGSGLVALWTTAALPSVVALSMLLAAALVAFKRLAQPASQKVMS